MAKVKRKSRYKSKYKRKKYQNAGMYTDNTVNAAGQGSIGSTANIVFEQNNPQILQQKLDALSNTKNEIKSSSKAMANEIQTQAAQDAIAAQQAGLAATQKTSAVGGAIGSTLESGKQMGIVDVGKDTAATGIKQAVNAYKTAKAAKLAERGAVGIKAGVQTAKQAAATAKAAKLTGQVAESTAKISGIPATIAAPTTTAGTAGAAAGAGAQGAAGAGTAASTGSSLGAGIASAAKNPNVLAAAANVAGKTVRYFSDDDDATTWTAGEATGDILGTAGEYAGYGAMLTSWLGPGAGIGAAVGGIIGAGVGIYKGITGRNKAKKAEREARKKRDAKVAKYNQEVREQMGSAMTSARSGEIEQKTTSGYDLGRNVIAKYGGARYNRGGFNLGIPRYGHKI